MGPTAQNFRRNAREDDAEERVMPMTEDQVRAAYAEGVGSGGPVAVAVSGALLGGKPVVDALKALAKRLAR